MKHFREQGQKPKVLSLQLMMFGAGEGTKAAPVSRSCLGRVFLEMRAGWAAQDNLMYLVYCIDNAQKVPARNWIPKNEDQDR